MGDLTSLRTPRVCRGRSADSPHSSLMARRFPRTFAKLVAVELGATWGAESGVSWIAGVDGVQRLRASLLTTLRC